MANKPGSAILTISDLVSESIKNKTLHQDYNYILDMCRDLKISSYALHRIIECELVRKETALKKIDKKSIGFVKLLMPEVTPDDTVIENKAGEHTKPADKQTVENEYDATEDNKIITSTKISYRWGWKTWILFIFMATVIAAIFIVINDSPTIQSMIRYRYHNLIR